MSRSGEVWNQYSVLSTQNGRLKTCPTIETGKPRTVLNSALKMPEPTLRSWIPRRAAVIGIGLLGGSVALMLRRAFPELEIVGCARRSATLEMALRTGAATEITADPQAACKGADLIIISTPVTSIADQVIAAAAVCDEDALITDVGSTKAQIVQQVEADARAAAKFVGSHPIAGGEKTGPQHARADLFVGRRVVLTPTDATPARQCERARELWQAGGAEVLCMSPAEHDKFLAATSHLPHLVAAALVSIIPREALPLVGSGWRDATRIAAGCPEMWAAICRENSAAIETQLRQMNRSLETLATAIGDGDFAAVERLLREASELRQSVENSRGGNSHAANSRAESAF